MRTTIALTAIGLLFAAQAESASYVLNASTWGAAQDKAVTGAGGTVTFKHAGAGVAVVQSNNPSFLTAVTATGAVTSGALDQVVEWVDPVATVAVPDAINPTDDRFYSHIQWAPQSVEAPAAWAAGWTGHGVRVAVIDGGIYANHQDLVGAIDVAASRSFVEPDPAATPAVNACRTAFDCDTGTFWHGTHVSGIIAARDNTLGIIGIAPEATIVGVKALHNGSGTFGAVIAAILYASSDGHADVINMSLGALFAKNEPGASELRVALSKAVKIASTTTLVVVAAGNDALSLDGNNLVVTPAESGPAMAVSATGPLGFAYGATNFSRFASYSNYGHSLVSVGGPGGDFAYPGNENCTLQATTGPVTIPCWAFDMVLSTSRGTTAAGGYTWAAGTSMATPAVAAVAALVKQKNPGIGVKALQRQLEKSAVPVDKNQSAFYGNGYINARTAVGN
jgi:subtilisin family serine protease